MTTKQIKFRAGSQEWTATLEDNATTRALIKKLPMTITMDNLNSREMCYRMGAGALPTDKLRSDRYEVGDVIYWPPRGSFVILYKQNGEQFERAQIGHIEGSVADFGNMDSVQITVKAVK